MAIKAGQILHDVNGYVVDRIQSAGPGNLNIPQEKIYELGNYNTVATIFDIPDLSFDLESFDVSTEFEWLLTNGLISTDGGLSYTRRSTPDALEANDRFDFNKHIPIDVISPFKSRKGSFDIVKGVAVPYLTLERATYRYGLRQNAAQQFTLRGDSIYYCPSTPFYKEYAFSAGPTFAFGNTASPYYESNNTLYALCVTLVNSTTGDYKRCFYNDESPTSGFYYTNTSTGFTLIADAASTTDYNQVRAVWSTTASTSYTQNGNNPTGNKIHQGTSTKPAAVRPKDINVFVGTGATTAWTRLTGVQSAEASWSVNLEMDEEFGNSKYVSMDYLNADVTGSIGFKPTDPTDLMSKLYLIALDGDSSPNGTADEVIGPLVTEPIEMLVEIAHPDTGAVLKSIHVPDARFQVPGMSGRVQQKLETTLSFTSEEGLMYVYHGSSGLRA